MRPLLILQSVMLLMTALSSRAEVISIRSDIWYPINGEPDSAAPGYMIEMAQIIARRAGHDIDYKLMPWERSLLEVRRGAYDCVVGAYKEDAPDFVFPESPWGVDEVLFYVRKGFDWRYEGVSSLYGIRLGVIGGYAYDEAFDRYVEANSGSLGVQVIYSNDALESNIRKLMLGRIQATLESRLVMQARLREMNLTGQIVPAGALGKILNMYIACSPARTSSQQYVRLFDQGLRQLRESGELAEILARYGVEDWVAESEQ